MYKAKMIKTIKAVPDGEVYPREYAPGDHIEGEIALVAVEHGWAIPLASGGAPTPFPAAASDPAVAGPDSGDTGERAKSKPRGRKPRTRKG